MNTELMRNYITILFITILIQYYNIIQWYYSSTQRDRCWLIRETKNIDRQLICVLNVNSASSKFDQLKFWLQGRVDILLLTKSKLGYSFPTDQFLVERYSKSLRFVRNRNGSSILLYVIEVIPCKEIKLHRHSHDVKGIFAEVGLRRTKLLLFAIY